MSLPEVDQYGTTRWYDESRRLHREDGPAVISENDTEQWYLCGVLHRVDGPAVIWSDGYEEWWLYGQRHREGGPAVEQVSSGHRSWYHKGLRHRTDGPAVEYANGKLRWFVLGEEYTDLEDYCDAAGIVDKQRTFFLLKYSGSRL